jgi:hypothetical protein
MKSLLRAWDRFWFSPCDPASAALFRIFLGSLMVVFYVANALNWERYYAASGVTSADVLDPGRTQQSWWNLFAWTERWVPVGNFWWLGLVCAVCFTIGFQTRLVTVVLFLIQASMIHASRMVANGEDLIFRTMLFYGIFAPLDEALAVDSWLERWRHPGPRAEVPLIWPIRLMQLNLLLIYVVSLPNKLADEAAWWDGTALYWTMMNGTWCRYPGWLLFAWWPFSALATYGTLLVEGSFPVLVWFRRTRLYSLVAIASLHIGIAIMLKNVTFFTLSMVCSFWLFVPPETTRRLLADLRSAGSRLVGWSSRSQRIPDPAAAAPAA